MKNLNWTCLVQHVSMEHPCFPAVRARCYEQWEGMQGHRKKPVIFLNFFFPVILLNTIKEAPEKWGCYTERCNSQVQQWGIAKLSVEAIKYSLLILIDFALSVKYCPATPMPFIQVTFYCYLNIFDWSSANTEHGSLLTVICLDSSETLLCLG